MMTSLIKFALKYIPRPLLISLSYFGCFFLKKYYKGDTFIDPIDGAKFSRLLPYGYGNQRKNALSPSTLSLERHRLMWLYLYQKTDFFKAKKKVLHVAPEQPFYKRFRKLKNLDYTTTDLLSPLADIKADLTNLPFDDNQYDIIFCNHVLEHILDDDKAMKELYRVMASNGWGIFQIPLDIKRKNTYENATITSEKERKVHFGQYDHVRIYGMDYFDRLRNVGFKVTASNFVKTLSSENITRYCLDENELLPLVQK